MLPFLERHFRILAAIPILIMVVLQFTSAAGESATYDEGLHLTAGYRYLRTGEHLYHPEHPPLQNLLNAVPLLFLNPRLPTNPAIQKDPMRYSRAFFYSGGTDADRMLLAARSVTILVTAFLAMVVAWATRRHFGTPAAIAAVWLCAFDPNLIAHGRYTTTDMACTFWFLLAVLQWIHYLQNPSKKRALRAALVLGLALSAKFSTTILCVVLPAILVVHLLVTRLPRPIAERRIAVGMFIIYAAFGVVALMYSVDTWNKFQSQGPEGGRDPVALLLLPLSAYINGVLLALGHSASGAGSYLLGAVSTTGWWYYFPVVVAVKFPTALLLLIVVGIGIGLNRSPRLFTDPSGSFIWAALSLPLLTYFGITMMSRLNLGVRHLLPLVPFLYILCTAALSRVLSPKRFLIAASGLIILQAVESFSIYPDYLAFFNMPSGGPAAGPKYLLDSNLDWGQDLKKLGTYVAQKKPRKVCLVYFGTSEPRYYGIEPYDVPRTWEKEKRDQVDCLGVISMSAYAGLLVEPGSFDWLRERTPIEIVGRSMYVFDLYKKR